MTISIFEFSDIEPGTNEPLWDTLVRRTAGVALANTYTQVGETAPIKAIVISNDDGTTGARVRFHTASSGGDASQADIFIAANSTRTFLIRRKRRSTTDGPTDDLYVNAVADT
jgi:hypothetical protein